MKNLLFQFLLISCALIASVHASDKKEEKDVRASKSFVKTCPEQYLTYIDKSEGGPGAYCACPDDKIDYLDKSEGGPGFFCSSL